MYDISYKEDIKEVWNKLGNLIKPSVLLKRAHRFFFLSFNSNNRSTWRMKLKFIFIIKFWVNWYNYYIARKIEDNKIEVVKTIRVKN